MKELEEEKEEEGGGRKRRRRKKRNRRRRSGRSGQFLRTDQAVPPLLPGSGKPWL